MSAMGLDSSSLYLPAPTETDSVIAPTELGTELSRNDEQSIYSLPSDGTPVTITTRKTRAKNTQPGASVLIEYFENGSAVSDATDRKPSVRVRLTSSKLAHGDHAGPSQTRSRASRRRSELEDIEDALMSPYASATEESTVSRNPVDPDHDRIVTYKQRSGKRPVSPLIPEPRMSNPPSSGLPPNAATGSDLSVIPTNSFLDDSGNSVYGENKRSASPLTKTRGQKPRQGERERIRLADKPIEKEKERERRSKSKSSRSRTSSLSAVQKEREREREKARESDLNYEGYSHISHRDSIGHSSKSRTRRSSRGQGQESFVSGADSVISSTVSRAPEAQSTRSSDVNSKLLAAVEVALRRVVIPELEAIKRETSKRESRRASGGSSITSASLDEVSVSTHHRRRSSQSRHRLPGDRDRERDRDRARERERVMSPESVDDYYAETPKRSPDQQHNRSNLSSAIAASTAMASAVSGRLKSPPPPEEKKSRRRRRDAPRKRVSDRYDDEFDDESVAPQPPMPLMSEINPSELTRLSLRTADDDRPASAMEEVTKSEVSDGGALLQPVVKEIKLGMQYANISHGDLRALPRGNKETEPPNNEIPSAFPQEYEPNEYGQKVPTRTRQEPTEELYDDPEPQLQTEHHYERDDYDNFYGQQDVPAHLKYVPYQPERRGLSPIYSVSGYTENSELAARESHIASNSEDYQSPPMSPRHNRRSSLISSNILNSDGLPHSEISSVAGYPRNPTYTDDLSELDVEPDQPVRGIGVNPKIMPGAPIESVVASLIDGSLMEQSVMTSATNAYPYYGPDSTVSYGVARSVVSYGPDSVVSSEDPKHVIRELTIKKKQSDVVMHDVSMVQEEFEDPEDADRSITPTAVEQAAFAAITSGALARVVQAKQIQINATPKDDVIPGGGAGVARNKSFKQRTMEGHEIATTPAHSVDRFYGDDQEPKLSSSALPDLDDPMPEYGDNLDLGSDITASILEQHLGVKHDIFDRGQEELSFIAGADDAISVAPTRDMSELDEVDEGNLTPRALSPKKSTVNADSNMTGADSTVGAHTQNPNGDHDDDATRTSAERKRETILTNPYENISPLASNRLSETFGFADQGHLPKDEGYVSNGPNRTPDNFNLDDPKEVSMPSAPAFGGVDDSFFTGRMSGLTPGPETPLYDPGMTSGGGSIHNKDIMTLMQDLVARDAQRNARDTEIAAMVMFLANEMRTHFQTVEDRIKQAEDVIIDEVQDSEKMVIKAINGPRPYPGPSSAPRSIGGTATANSSNAGPEMTMAAKKGNILRRALNGLNVTGAKDLSRIEVMLHQLLEEVMELKDHQVQPQPQAGSTFENLGGDSGENDTIDGGYDPEGRAGTSIASHGSQSMSTSRISTSRSAHFDRKYSDHRVSTVHEGDEEEALDTTYDAPHDDRASTPVLNQETGPRGESIVMATPSREPAIPAAFAQTSAAALPTASPLAPENESSPKSAGKSEKSRKHKSTGSSGFGARISRWSETTASTLSKAFRSSGGSSKKNEPYMQNPDSGSRSGSDFAGYNDNSYRPRTAPYSNDKLHTGFSDQNLDRTPSPGASATPLMPSYMNPEHPKYHVHRNSLNLQHPQPRQGNSERFKNNLESQARIYDTTNTPRSADWGHSVSSLNSLQPANAHGMAEASLPPPRPPKEAIGSSTPRSNRIAKNAAHSSPSYEAQHHQYAPAADSPRTRDVDRLAGMPTRRPSGPRAMTPKTPNDESYEERRRNRNTFGSVASRASADTDTF